MFNPEKLISELHFKTSRSSGSGGQNVNKVATKVELIFHIESSLFLDSDQKMRIHEQLASRIRSDGSIHLSSQTERTQLRNKERAIERFLSLLEAALRPVKKRKKSRISLADKEKRRQEKKKKSLLKELRRKPFQN